MKETQTRQKVKGKKMVNIITDVSEATESMKQEKSVTGKDILKKKRTLNIFQKDERQGFLTQPQIFIRVCAYELVTDGFVLFLHKYDLYYVYLHLILFH